MTDEPGSPPVASPSAPCAKQDLVTAVDTHVVMVPSPAGPVPTPMPLPFLGTLDGGLAPTIEVDNKSAAVVGSTATNSPPHVAPGGTFQRPPSDAGTIQAGSATVFMDGQAVARNGDPAMTCGDPADAPEGTVVAVGTVIVG